jgi:hypothetical protein
MTPRAGIRATACGLLVALAASSDAMAGYVGDYFFPSTLATIVPTPADFYNPPYLVRLPATATTRETDIPTTYSKLITQNWSVLLTETYRILDQPNGTRSGFDNLVLGTQYELYSDTRHQFIVTVGGNWAIGGTGSSPVNNSFSTLTPAHYVAKGFGDLPGTGLAAVSNSYSTFTPTLYVGKGLGDLPESLAWLRPLGITANIAVAVPTKSTILTTTTLPTGATAAVATVNPDVLLWSFALEYSGVDTSLYNERGTRYARGFVPVVEFAFTTPLNGPLAGEIAGTINPGIIWVGRYLQFGVEAVIPINSASGHDIGVRAQAHLYLPQIFPDTLGRPIFGK